MKINFHNQTDQEDKMIVKTLKKVFKKIAEKKTMEVVFVNNQEMINLNLTFRNINKSTDVLSFPSDEKKSLGDIFISIDKAIEQADEYGHSLLREICFLTVHGFLHLTGYDHDTKENEEKMFKLQEEILNKEGLERKI